MQIKYGGRALVAESMHEKLHASEYTSLRLHGDSTLEGLSVAPKSLVAKLMHDKLNTSQCTLLSLLRTPPCAMEQIPGVSKSLVAD